MRQGHYRIDRLFQEGNTSVTEEEELKAAGFSLEAFRNLNTPEDVTKAEERNIDS